MGREAYDELGSLIHDSDVVHRMIEDYRADLRIDHTMTAKIGRLAERCAV